MATTPTPTKRETYAGWLDRQMKDRGFTQRSLAREIDANRAENWRRSIRRYLKGMVPLERTRRLIADALGTGEDLGPDDPEEDD